MNHDWKDSIAFVYYTIATVSVILVFIRLVYAWFRDFDNSQRFITDMAKVHLPHIYDCFEKIADRLDIKLEKAPTVNFSEDRTPGH